MTYDIDKIATAIKKAHAAAQEYSQIEDFGTCNLDTPYITAYRMSMDTARTISNQSGVHCHLGKHFRARVLFIAIGEGQAARRTKMAETACKSLSDSGLDACMYYQMD